MTVTDTLSVIISFLALGVSVAAFMWSAHYANMEYSYKIDPQIEGAGRIGVQKISAENDKFKVGITEFEFSITAKNNLNRAYIIYANNQVEELELDDMENILDGKTESDLTSTPDIKSGKYEYRYYFVYLESLDDHGELYLIYTKTYPGSSGEEELTFDAISGIEVYGLGNESHENAEEYAGERIMAEEYVRILSELPKYIAQ